MILWFNIIRDVLANVRGGDRRGLNDTWVSRRRSFESMRNIFKGMDLSGGGVDGNSILNLSRRRKDVDPRDIDNSLDRNSFVLSELGDSLHNSTKVPKTAQ